MSLYDTAHAQLLGKGQLSPSGSITDKELASLLRGYRRTVVAGYRSLVPDEVSVRLPAGKMYVSPKIDGELWFLILDGESAILGSPRGQVIAGEIPVLNEALTVAGRCTGRTVIAGELFAVKKEGRPRVGDLVNAMGGGAKAKVERLGFAAFDLVAGGDSKTPVSLDAYEDRIETLQRILEGGKRVKVVRTELVNTSSEVLKYFNEWVESGKAEGIVVGSADGRIFKIKPSFTVDAVVIGYTERAEDPSQVRSFALALMRQDKNFQYISSCGNLGDEANRKKLMEMLQGLKVQSNWRQTSGDGALYRFVKPEIVVEIKASDVQSEDSSGQMIQKMALSFSDDEWQALRKFPGPSLLHPVFVRVRGDKQVNPEDVRLGQVQELCYVADTDITAEAVTLPESTVVRREVYTKKSKKGTAIRKLVMWKTNKEKIDSSYSAYVVHWTDYSPGRKNSLDREVRLAPNENTANVIAETMLTENVKKGWLLEVIK